jgi:hypothetical protein
VVFISLSNSNLDAANFVVQNGAVLDAFVSFVVCGHRSPTVKTFQLEQQPTEKHWMAMRSSVCSPHDR